MVGCRVHVFRESQKEQQTLSVNSGSTSKSQKLLNLVLSIPSKTECGWQQ